MDNLFNFLIAFLIVLLIVFAIEGGPAWALLLLPIPLFSLVLGVFALSWCLAIAQIFFRDTRFLVSFALQACFFLTPIFYPKEFISPHWQWLTSVNPFFRLIDPFQILIHDFAWGTFIVSAAISLATSLGFLALAAAVWRRQKPLIYFHV